MCRKSPCPQRVDQWNSPSVFLSSSTRNWASSWTLSSMLLFPIPKFLRVMREKRRICFHVSPLLKRIPRKSKERESWCHRVGFSLKLISFQGPLAGIQQMAIEKHNLFGVCVKYLSQRKENPCSGQQGAETMGWDGAGESLARGKHPQMWEEPSVWFS